MKIQLEYANYAKPSQESSQYKMNKQLGLRKAPEPEKKEEKPAKKAKPKKEPEEKTSE